MLKIAPPLAVCLVANTAFAQTCQTTQAQALSAAGTTATCASLPYVTMSGSTVVNATTGQPVSLASYTPDQVSTLTNCAQSTLALQSIANPQALAAVSAVGSVAGQPSPAAQAGYNLKTFGPSMANWVPYAFFGMDTSTLAMTQNGDGSVTIAGGIDNFNGQLATANPSGQGTVFGGGFYAEATISVPGQTEGLCCATTAFPAFWANSISGYMGTGSNVEVDFMEMDAQQTGQYGYDIINWSDNRTSIGSTEPDVNTGANLNAAHKYGFLWIPATATTQGQASFYFDGNQVGTQTWSQGQGVFSAMDGLQYTLILGAGANSPMNVSSVVVWQKSTAGDSINGSQAASIGAGPSQTGPAICAAADPTAATSPAVTDAGGNAWAVTTAGTVTVNGKAAAFTADVARVITVNGTTYQETTFGGWWGWDGAGWVGVSGDPTQGAVAVTTVADNKGQNYAVSPGAVLANDKLSAPVTPLHVADAEALTTAQAAALEGR